MPNLQDRLETNLQDRFEEATDELYTKLQADTAELKRIFGYDKLVKAGCIVQSEVDQVRFDSYWSALCSLERLYFAETQYKGYRHTDINVT